MKLRRAFLWILIVSLGAAAVLGIAMLLMPGLADSDMARIIGTAMLVSGSALACLLCSIIIDRGRCVSVMWMAMISAIVAGGLWIALMWGASNNVSRWPQWPVKLALECSLITGWGLFTGLLMLRKPATAWLRRSVLAAVAMAATLALLTTYVIWWEDDDWWVLQIYVTAIVLAGWLGWSSVLTIAPLKRRGFHIARIATLGALSLLAVLIALLIWDIIDNHDDLMGRVIGVLSILAACGTVMTWAMVLIDRRTGRQAGATMPRSGTVTLDLKCPRCESNQKLKAGHSQCGQCGLRFQIEVEEPRCVCGYLLYQLSGEACPECGRKIDAGERWVSAANGGAR